MFLYVPTGYSKSLNCVSSTIHDYVVHPSLILRPSPLTTGRGPGNIRDQNRCKLPAGKSAAPIRIPHLCASQNVMLFSFM